MTGCGCELRDGTHDGNCGLATSEMLRDAARLSGRRYPAALVHRAVTNPSNDSSLGHPRGVEEGSSNGPELLAAISLNGQPRGVVVKLPNPEHISPIVTRVVAELEDAK